jgi:hypothetical protein
MKTPREKNFKNRSGRRAGKAVSHDQGPGAPRFPINMTERRVLAAISGGDTLAGVSDADVMFAVGRVTTGLTQHELIDALAYLQEEKLIDVSRLDRSRWVITAKGKALLDG